MGKNVVVISLIKCKCTILHLQFFSFKIVQESIEKENNVVKVTVTGSRSIDLRDLVHDQGQENKKPFRREVFVYSQVSKRSQEKKQVT